MTTSPRRRRLPRFSLRSLLLLVLLAASGLGLWWHWAPWTRVSSSWTIDPEVRAQFNKEVGEEDRAIWYIGLLPELDQVINEMGPPSAKSVPQSDALAERALYLWNSDHSLALFTSPHNGHHILRYNHPSAWWGVAWLPEFWLTLAFAAALSWSLWKDRKAIAGR